MENADLKLLRMFTTVVDCGGFASAQGSLNLSLSTISGHMTALETRLGLVLCSRGRSGFALTAEGRAVYAEAERIFATVRNFESRIKGLRGKHTGKLTIGLVDNTVTDPSLPLERVFGRFTEAAPDVVLSVQSRGPVELLRAVENGSIDLAIGSFPHTVGGLVYDDLYLERHGFYCGAAHRLFGRDDSVRLTPEELLDFRFVGRFYWNNSDLERLGFPAVHASVADMESELRLILSGAYLGYLPEHYARSYVSAGRLRAIEPDRFCYEARFRAVTAPAVRGRGVVGLFRDLLLSEARINGAGPI